MPFSPEHINIVFNQNSIPVEYVDMTCVQYGDAPAIFSIVPFVIGKPDWLLVSLDNFNNEVTPNEVRYRLTTTPTAYSLSPGIYTGFVFVHYQVIINEYQTLSWNDILSVELEVQETVNLAVTPTVLEFQHVIGDALPSNKFISIVSENSWNILSNQSWLQLPQSSGNLNATVAVGVDVSGMSTGNYQGILIVDDGVAQQQKQVDVTLVITGEDNETDYLYVSPIAFQFSEVLSVAPNKTGDFVVDASEDFTITDDVSWLSYSATSGNSGQTTITINTVNTESLPLGVYIGTITVSTSYTLKNISVLLRITEVEITGVQSNGFYYAKDRVRLNATSDLSNIEMLIDFNTTATSGILPPYTKKVPFVNNLASVIIGNETETLLAPNSILTNYTTRITVPLSPIKMSFKVYEKVIGSSLQTLKDTYTNIEFVNGKTPSVSNYLSYLPTNITTVKDAIVTFTFKSDTVPTTITISGDVDATIGTSGLSGKLFTVLVNLADYTLASGDNITISCGGFEVNVTIQDSEPEHTKLFWENEWQCIESKTLTGTLTQTEALQNTYSTIAIDGKDKTVTVDSDEPQSFVVSTGYIMSVAETKWLSTLLRSKRIWLEYDGNLIEVVCATKKLTPYKTREHLYAYKLTFNKALV